ncbi:hypothetical protein RUM44_008629 [Polyplax serrata]|uniref:Uncharacterized protein n=1 Tax=Polyplax serrata TaxID=468196 RepID=A0ABR1BCS2_POLSC
MESTLTQRARVGVEDFTLLEEYQDINAFVENLRKRFVENLIYTYIGNVLISVNPFKPLPIYSPELISQYSQSHAIMMSPHIYAVSNTAYRLLSEEHREQCILISGESGSGKTEASKRVLEFVAAATGHHQRVESIKDKLLQSIPVLEAFGNAKTNRNDNSSRFGKYMDVAFNLICEPVGGHILNYLLEKSRVVCQNDGERNFHIFYQMLAGADADTLNKFNLNPTPESYSYLKHNDKVRDKTVNEKQYKEFEAALNVVGISESEKTDILAIVASILHMGNISFTEVNDVSEIVDKSHIKIISQILECDSQLLEKALTKRTIEAGGERVVTNLTSDMAAYARDALAKSIYDKLFTWLVNRVNSSIQSPESESKSVTMGILDIYGFEIFEKNSFEQFCINYCNEKLQQLFIHLTLKQEQEEYIREEIEWVYIDFYNNKVICDLIEDKRMGIIGILNEECFRPGNTQDSDFLDKLNENLLYHKHYINHQKSDPTMQKVMRRDDFRLVHYAGEVIYNVQGFLDKNNDLLFRDSREVVIDSTNSISKTFFTNNEINTKKRPDTTINQFKKSLNDLTEILMSKEPSYIRCIKPNDFQRKDDFDFDLVKHQVKYLGLMENLRVRRAGYAYRRCYTDFFQRYKCLSKSTWPNYAGNPKDGVQILINDLGYPSEAYQMGKTKIFLRSPVTLFKIEDSLQLQKHYLATVIQKTWRGRRDRLEYQKTLENIILTQKIIRGFLARRKTEKIRHAALTIRRFIEGFTTRHGAPTAANRFFIETSKALWLNRLSKQLPVKVTDKSWPPCPMVCQETSEIIRILYMKQLALIYRRKLTPEMQKKYEQKVLAEKLFKGKKKSYMASVPEFFAKDRLLPQQKQLMVTFQNSHSLGEKFQYSTAVTKYDRHGYKPRERALLISGENVYLLDGKTFRVKHKISINSITEILVSKETDNFLLLRLSPELKHLKGDLILQVPHLIEAATSLVDITHQQKNFTVASKGQISHNIINEKPGTIDITTGSAGNIPKIYKAKKGKLIVVG